MAKDTAQGAESHKRTSAFMSRYPFAKQKALCYNAVRSAYIDEVGAQGKTRTARFVLRRLVIWQQRGTRDATEADVGSRAGYAFAE